MSDQKRNLPHLYLSGNGESENYTSPSGGGGALQPLIRDREDHATTLRKALNQAINEAKQKLDSRDPEIAVGTSRFYLEFQINSDKADAFESLENKTKGIELVAVRKSLETENMLDATVFVPKTATDHFLSKVEQYRSEDTKFEKPKNQALVARIQSVQIGNVRSLFTDDMPLFPQNKLEIWWEVWLRKNQGDLFKCVSQKLNLITKQHLIFPEREVILTLANLESMTLIIDNNSDLIAELRIAKDSPSFFLDMGSIEQEE